MLECLLSIRGWLKVSFVIGLFCSSVQAASLSVSPVLITLDSSAAIAAMTVTNRGDDAVVMQAFINDWSIRDNQEHYEETDRLVVSPPVFEIAPGKSQIVRIGLLDTEPKMIEQSFRVFFEQAPATPNLELSADNSTTNYPRGVQIMLRMGVPVFVKSVMPSASRVVWSAQRQPDGRLRIEADNQGGAHAKISRLALIDNGKTVASAEQLSYILPGSRRHWVLDVPAGVSAPYRIKVETKDGVLDTTVSASAP
ncbi:MAG: fimbria/pilus periplasmic chaperone [Pseudomonas sp.]|nr:fimbria/pilus periplasmic chaperone [Pseudomonas sp.]